MFLVSVSGSKEISKNVDFNYLALYATWNNKFYLKIDTDHGVFY